MGLSGPKRHTDKTGDISEAAIITRLLQSGYVVLTPYGKNHRYDLLIEDADGKFWRIQCKTGWMDEEQTQLFYSLLLVVIITQQSKKGGDTIEGKQTILPSIARNLIRSTLSL